MIFTKSFFSDEERKALVAAIAEAEGLTSGEVRVHIEPSSKGKAVLDRAVEVFTKLDMQKTAARNGVLIYVAHEDHQLAIIGDKGINEVVPDNFWESTKDTMLEHFKKGEFFQGILFAIKSSGDQLKHYFPLENNDKNELQQ
jgi:uncharacterized membrane protein